MVRQVPREPLVHQVLVGQVQPVERLAHLVLQVLVVAQEHLVQQA